MQSAFININASIFLTTYQIQEWSQSQHPGQITVYGRAHTEKLTYAYIINFGSPTNLTRTSLDCGGGQSRLPEEEMMQTPHHKAPAGLKI